MSMDNIRLVEEVYNEQYLLEEEMSVFFGKTVAVCDIGVKRSFLGVF